jgi:DMSO/TMAO reductase YedYZ molybdopterin-dependent catalytic subunit
MGDGLLPALDPTHPYDEGVDLDTLMPPLALIVAAANARLLWLVTRPATTPSAGTA